MSQPQPAPFAEVREKRVGGAGHASTRLWVATKRDMHRPACEGCADLVLLPCVGLALCSKVMGYPCLGPQETPTCTSLALCAICKGVCYYHLWDRCPCFCSDQAVSNKLWDFLLVQQLAYPLPGQAAAWPAAIKMRNFAVLPPEVSSSVQLVLGWQTFTVTVSLTLSLPVRPRGLQSLVR